MAMIVARYQPSFKQQQQRQQQQQQQQHFRGGRPALPSDGLLHGGPVVTGKPGIRLAHSSSGLAHSLLPALCRQDTSCAWRSRLRTRCTTTDLDDLIVWIGSCCCEVVAAKMQNSVYSKIATEPMRNP